MPSKSSQNIIDILTQDHRKVEKLFDQLLKAKNDQISQTFTQLYNLLDMHAKIEETAFYPLLKKEIEEDILEAVEEHLIVKDCLNALNAINIAGEYNQVWTTKIQVLKEMVEHHVQEEETEVFPKAKKQISAEKLEDLGNSVTELTKKMEMLKEV